MNHKRALDIANRLEQKLSIGFAKRIIAFVESLRKEEDDNGMPIIPALYEIDLARLGALLYNAKAEDTASIVFTKKDGAQAAAKEGIEMNTIAKERLTEITLGLHNSVYKDEFPPEGTPAFWLGRLESFLLLAGVETCAHCGVPLTEEEKANKEQIYDHKPICDECLEKVKAEDEAADLAIQQAKEERA